MRFVSAARGSVVTSSQMMRYEDVTMDGRLLPIAATAGGRYALGGGWGLFGYARAERLVGDAKRSPIIREHGSPNQLSAGLGLSHTFSLDL